MTDTDTAFQDVMVDIETASTDTNNALVLSIAWVPFTMLNCVGAEPVFGDAHIAIPSIREQLGMGRKVSEGTLEFWAKQTRAARAHWADPGSVMPVKRALDLLRESTDCRRVWAHGVCFDIGNLEALYRSQGEDPPWKYNDVRDARTIYRATPTRRQKPLDLEFVDHHPVDDCKKQIWQLWERWSVVVAE